MAEEKKEAPQLVHIENIHAPEVYADWWQHFHVSHGNVKITLISNRVDTANKQLTTVVVGRLTMPIAGARAMVEGLYNFLQQEAPEPKPSDPNKLN